MNQKLSDWASIAEILSGVAVVATLIFLIVGIRENTEVARAAAYGGLVTALNYVGTAIAQDEALAGIWQSYREGDSEELSDDEEFRLRTLLRNMWRIYEWAYYSNQYDTLGSAEWDRFERAMCASRGDSEQAQWNYIEIVLTEEFSGYIASNCRDDL